MPLLATWSITASYVPWRRSVPCTSSVTKAASRPVMLCSVSIAGSARLT
jgi:hypothetical protein